MIFDSVIIFDHVKPRLIVLVNAHNAGRSRSGLCGCRRAHR